MPSHDDPLGLLDDEPMPQEKENNAPALPPTMGELIPKLHDSIILAIDHMLSNKLKALEEKILPILNDQTTSVVNIARALDGVLDESAEAREGLEDLNLQDGERENGVRGNEEARNGRNEEVGNEVIPLHPQNNNGQAMPNIPPNAEAPVRGAGQNAPAGHPVQNRAGANQQAEVNREHNGMRGGGRGGGIYRGNNRVFHRGGGNGGAVAGGGGNANANQRFYFERRNRRFMDHHGCRCHQCNQMQARFGRHHGPR